MGLRRSNLNKTKLTGIVVNMDDDLHSWLKNYCARVQKTMTRLIIELLEIEREGDEQ